MLPDDGWYVVEIHFETVKKIEPKDVNREWSRIMIMELKLL